MNIVLVEILKIIGIGDWMSFVTLILGTQKLNYEARNFGSKAKY